MSENVIRIVISQAESNERIVISQAESNEGDGAWAFVFYEIFLISMVLGIRCQSWWVFGGVLLSTSIAMMSTISAVVLCLALSLCWGAIGYGIGILFSSLSASIIFAIFAFFIALAKHFAA